MISQLRSCATPTIHGLLALATALGFPQPTAASPTGRPSLATEAEVARETFIYKTVGKLNLKADVYRPDGDRARPVVIWLHPGALIMGSRDMLLSDERDRLLGAGFIVVAVDYRLAPETKLPEILRDVEDAHRWVRTRGPALFGADPMRIATMGASAGGYLALMAGARVQPRLRAIVSLYGYGDLTGAWYSRPDSFYNTLPRISREVAYRAVGNEELSEGSMERDAFYRYCRQNGQWPREVVGLDPDTDAAKYGEYSPERLAGPDFPPTLLLHGDQDVDVPFQMSERMAAALTRQRVDHSLIRMAGLNHAFDFFATFPPEGPPIGLSQPRIVAAFDSVVAFLGRQLRR
jgi:acetyl esterase/lipase